MKDVELKGHKVQEVQFISKLENGAKIELETAYSYNVGYGNNNMCRGEISVTMKDKINPDKFFAKVVLIGVFAYNPELTKETVHVVTYKEIFPFIKAFMVTLTANAGIPPIMIPGIDIESQNIYRLENPPKNNGGNI